MANPGVDVTMILKAASCGGCKPDPQVTDPIAGTENIVMLMEQADEAHRQVCCYMEDDPWGDDFQDEIASRGRWNTLGSLEELYYQTGDHAPDYPSQRRGCIIECATLGNFSHIEYKRVIPPDKEFRGEIEFHGDWIYNAFLWNWMTNFGHLAWFKWYVTDGTKSAGLSWYSENKLDEGGGGGGPNMGYFLDEIRYVTVEPFPMHGYSSDHPVYGTLYTGHRYAIERKEDNTIELYHWSNERYFQDGSGEWTLAYTVPADFFPEGAELKFRLYLQVNGHVNPGAERWNKIGYDNFTVPIVPV